jgi:hypothetical protein
MSLTRLISRRAAGLLVRGLLVAAVALVAELLAGAGLSLLERRGMRYEPILGDRLSAPNRQAIEGLLAGRESPFQLDGVLGWTLRPGFRSPQVAVDALGRRRAADRPPPAPDAVRLAAFGDSFTFGGDVVDRDSYPEALARLDSGIDVANYGVPAYGLDQAFLRYLQERGSATPQVVIIGYLAENICRNVSVFRPFYNQTTVFPLAKPRYRLAADGLELLPSPLATPESYRRLLAEPARALAELGRHDAHYRWRPHASGWDQSAGVRLVKLALAQLAPANRDGCYGSAEAFAVTTRLFRLFYETVLQDGAQPVILVFPTREDVVRWSSGRRSRYASLLQFFDEEGYRFIDGMAVFEGAGRNQSIDELIPGHLSPLANTLVAEHLRERLRGFGLVDRAGAEGRLH